VAAAAVAEGLLLREPVQEHLPRRRVEPAAVGDRRQGDDAQATRPWQGRLVIQAVAMKRSRPTRRQPGPRPLRVLGVVIGSLDGASPSAPRDEASIRVGVDAGLLMGGGRS
jgi:hypothetical protein